MKKNLFTVSDIRSERLALPFYFLSDNHLSTRQGPQQKKRIDDMLVLLEEIRQSNGTLFILGDFFDFWFDKNGYIPSELKPVVEALESIIDTGIEIHYVGGNHDFWIKGYLTGKAGIRFYPDAIQFEWNGTRFYCQHGDHVVYENSHYPKVRRLIRNKFAIFMLKLLPIKWTYKLGERVSHYNRYITDEPYAVSDLQINTMQKELENKCREGYDICLSGHVHKPYMSRSGDGCIIAILGDWISHRSYALMDDQGFRLIDVKR